MRIERVCARVYDACVSFELESSSTSRGSPKSRSALGAPPPLILYANSNSCSSNYYSDANPRCEHNQHRLRLQHASQGREFHDALRVRRARVNGLSRGHVWAMVAS